MNRELIVVATPLIYLIQFFGLHPLENRILKHLFSITHLCLHLMLAATAINTYFKVLDTKEIVSIDDVVSSMFSICYQAERLAILLDAYVNESVLIKFIPTFDEIDNVFKKYYGLNPNSKLLRQKIHIRATLFLLPALVGDFLVTALIMNEFTLDFLIDQGAYLSTRLIVFIKFIQINLGIDTIKERIRLAIDCLMQIKLDNDETIKIDIRRLSQIHDDAIDMLTKWKDYISLSVVIIYTSEFVSTLSKLFWAVRDADLPDNRYGNILLFIALASYFQQLYILNENCNDFSQISKKFKHTRQLMLDARPSMKTQSEAYLYNGINEPDYFAIYNMFSLGRKFPFTFTAAIISFFLIVVQLYNFETV